MVEQIGVIGLAVMRENLVLNLSDHGASVALYHRTAERTQRFIEGPATGWPVRAASSLTAQLIRAFPHRVCLYRTH